MQRLEDGSPSMPSKPLYPFICSAANGTGPYWGPQATRAKAFAPMDSAALMLDGMGSARTARVATLPMRTL